MTQKPHDPGRNVSEAVDDPRATGEAADEGRGHGDGREAPGPGAQGQAAREPGHQKAATAQRQAGGWVAVIGHAASRKSSVQPREDEVHLHSAAREGDGSAARGEDGQRLGHEAVVNQISRKERLQGGRHMGTCRRRCAPTSERMARFPALCARR